MTTAEKMRAQTDFYEGDFYIPEEWFYALCDLLGAAEEEHICISGQPCCICAALTALRQKIEEAE